MTEAEFTAEMSAALERALLNPDYPTIKTTEEAEALHERGMVKLWGLVASLTPAVATGEYLDRWLMGTETAALPDDTKPNHVRDAVRANQ